jgi:gas vesicle protein
MTTYELQHGSESKAAGGLIAGILIGGLVGAVTLLLVTPKSGKDTRKYIQVKAIELRDKTTASLETVSGQVSSKASQLKTGINSKATELTRQGKDALARQLDRLSIAAQNGKNSLQPKNIQ